MHERLQLEIEEGKKYNEAGISIRFQMLNKKFIRIHGLSVMVNLIVVFSVIVYPFLLPPLNL